MMPRPVHVPSEWFARPSPVHDVSHTQRVYANAQTIAGMVDTDVDVTQHVTQAVLAAALWHDIGRRNDDVDPEHGHLSAERAVALGLADALDARDRAVALFAVRYHSRADAAGQQAVKSEDEPLRALKALWILKDADALDRTRLGDLNPSFLRLPCSLSLVDPSLLANAATQAGDRFFHYTTGAFIGKILDAGYLGWFEGERASNRFSTFIPQPEVWVSTAETWEPAAMKYTHSPIQMVYYAFIGRGDIANQMQRDQADPVCVATAHQGLYRIELNPALGFKTYAELARTDPEITEDPGYGMDVALGSSMSQWRYTAAPVMEEDWLGIDVWRGAAFKGTRGCLPACKGEQDPPEWVRVDADEIAAQWDERARQSRERDERDDQWIEDHRQMRERVREKLGVTTQEAR